MKLLVLKGFLPPETRASIACLAAAVVAVTALSESARKWHLQLKKANR